MRIVKTYGLRTEHFNNIQEETKKYILVYEGEETEVQYFQGVIDNRLILGINPIIDLLPLLRSAPQKSFSHPLRILELLSEHIDNYGTIKMLINKVMDYCVENLEISSHSVYSKEMLRDDLFFYFLDICKMSLEDEIQDKEKIIQELSEFLESKLDLTNQIAFILKYIDEQQIVFSRDLDFICLIVDRDRRSVKPNQYDIIIEKCKEMGIKLYVTNPTFEFWLLLHSDKIFEYTPEQLLLNRKTGNKRFLEVELSKVFDGYKKGKIHFDKFLPYIKRAIENEKLFCQDEILLKDELGSNVGLLLEEIID